MVQALKTGTVKTVYAVTRWDGDRPVVILLLAKVEGRNGGEYKVCLKSRDNLDVGAELIGDEERGLMEFGAQFVGQEIEFSPSSSPPWIGDFLPGLLQNS